MNKYDSEEGQLIFIEAPRRTWWQQLKWRLWGHRRITRNNILPGPDGRIRVNRKKTP